MIVAPELREYFRRLGFPEPDPAPVPCCETCLRLVGRRSDAREQQDPSAASAANVLLRRHQRDAH